MRTLLLLLLLSVVAMTLVHSIPARDDYAGKTIDDLLDPELDAVKNLKRSNFLLFYLS